MIRWKSKCTYRAGNYPVIALVDLFFVLLVIFILSNSMFYLPGVHIVTNAGHAEAPEGRYQVSSLDERRTFSQFVIADKMVLTLLADGSMELNSQAVTMETLDDALERESGKLLKMYQNSRSPKDGKTSVKGFRPKLVLSATPGVTAEKLDKVIAILRGKQMDVVYMLMKTAN